MKQDRRDSGADDILSFVEKYGVERKDAAEMAHGAPRQAVKRGLAHRQTLDLHGLHSDDAARKLRYTLDRCLETGKRELLVIHGYGRHSNPNEGPVLKKLVRDLLDNDYRPKYRSYRTADVRDGGDGATLVAVK